MGENVKKILVVDDEESIVDILKTNLEREGYKIITAGDGNKAVELAKSEKPDLIILDWMMPNKDGKTACKEIRALELTIPIIMLTAKGEDIDIVLGLEMGADDYMTKPFKIRELMARVNAQLRRTSLNESASTGTSNVMKFDGLEIDLEAYQVRRDGQIVNLTIREFELVRFLAENAGQVFSREALLERVWGYEYYGDVRTVDVTVRRTREKLEPDQNQYKYILTRRGVGYYFERH
ncbi:MAG TPA: response regulator [Bacillota bacterium]|nr:response regulator [Bacillota bacterium]